VLCETAVPEQMVQTELPLANIAGFIFSTDSRRLVATDDSGHLTAWDISGQRVITNFAAHAGPAYPFGAGFRGGGHSLLTCDEGGTAKEWDAGNWSEIQRFQLDSGATAWAICPETGLVATMNVEQLFELFSTQSPDKRLHFTGQSRIHDLKFSHDGKILASASDSGAVELWDTATGTRYAALRGVLLGYHSVAFSADAERLAASSGGQEAIKIWDLHSLEEVATLPGKGSLFDHAQFSADGNTIAADNWKGVIHFWSAPSWVEIRAAEKARQTAAPP
jgi:WD40 repeat protein